MHDGAVGMTDLGVMLLCCGCWSLDLTSGYSCKFIENSDNNKTNIQIWSVYFHTDKYNDITRKKARRIMVDKLGKLLNYSASRRR